METTLEEVKNDPELMAVWQNKSVRIWSNEHQMYWRPGRAGYTSDGLKAGIYKFPDAFTATRHCGPEKKICFRTISQHRTNQ